MIDNDAEISVKRIQAALEIKLPEEAVKILQELHPADRAEVFDLLDDSTQELLLPMLDISSTADMLEEMEDDSALDAIENLSPDKLADVLDEMEPDDAADLLGDLPAAQVSETLAQMEDADEVIPLLGYPDDTAGGLMTTSYLALRRHTSAEQAIQFIRQVSPDTSIPYYLYVVDREKRLIGVVGLRTLIIASQETLIETIMDREVISVSVGVDQEEVARVLTRYDLAALPVVDDQNRLVGVITHDDVSDVIEDEATEDILHLGGVETGPVIDKPYWSQRVLDVVRSRFFWLLILFIGQTVTGSIMQRFEGELEIVVDLAIFIPLLIGTGGNAGAQTVSTIIRALALREVKPRDVIWVWFREAQTGLFLGILIGIVAYTRAIMWGVDWHLALTVGITVMAIVLWANSVAALVPLGASQMGMDPTLLSGPLMATFIDGTGLLIYFSLAAWILPQL
jgi:magnesium transporter